ncbi:MAG: hypothetical protein HYR67_08895 [Bacteroidetes bacterium]|nr:hypothetical protein [Bacteroidota bacterium]
MALMKLGSFAMLQALLGCNRTKSTLSISKVFVLVISFLSIANFASGQIAGDYRTSGAGTNWNVVANWQLFNGATWGAAINYPGQVATPGTVTILTGQTMNVNVTPAFSIGNLTTAGSSILTVNAGFTLTITGTLTIDGTSQVNGANATSIISTASLSVPVSATNARMGALTLTVTGATTVAGTFTLNNNTGSKTFAGAVSNSGSWTSTAITPSNTVIFQNGVSSTGSTFAAGSATFNTNAQSIGGTAAMSFANSVIVTGVVVTNNNSSAVTISNTGAASLSGTGTFTQGNNSTLVYAGQTLTVTTFNATNAGNTVNYTGSVNPTTIRAVNYYHLTYSGSVTGNIGATTTVSGDLTTSNSGILNINGAFTVTVSGNLTMDNTSQITGTAATRVLNVSTNFSVPATATDTRISSLTLTVTGTTTVAGTFSLTSDTGVKTFIGAVSNSGSWTSTAVTTTNNLVFRNGVSSTGTTFAAGTATFNTNAQSIGGTAAMSFANTVTATGIAVTNNNTNTVTLSNTGAGVLAGTGSFVQGANSTLSYAGSTITITTFTPTGSGNTVNFTGATPTIPAVSYYHLTYSGTTAPTVTTANIAGDLTVSSGSFSPSGLVTFNNGTASAQTISGAGTISFASVTLNTATTNVNVNRSISVSGTLTFSTARIMVVNSSSNITLGSAGTIAGAASDRYIQLDGLTGTNSNLIKTTTAATGPWAITYPIGTSSGGYTPVTLPTVTTAPVANSTLSIKAIYNLSSQGQLRRVFRLIVAGNANATTFSNGAFNYNNATDISAGDAESNYTVEWYLAASSASAAWTNIATITHPPNNIFTVAGGSSATASLSTGTYYYTNGSADAYPNTWYSYQTGVWSNWQNWTSDPSGTTLVNGLNLPPQPGDAIVILNGITITNDVNGQVATTTTINNGATLDMSTTTGNTLGTLSGTGLLRIKGIALPTGTYTAFVTASTGGTIEYYDVTGTLPTAQTTYNNLKLTNSTASAITFTETNNLTINNNFNITASSTGTVTWQINDATNANRTITIAGDLTVSSNGKITAGTGNSGSATQHSLTLSGNLTNNGIIQFFDPTDATYSAANYTSGAVYTSALRGNAVKVTFSGTTSKTLTCNNQTDFYRLILDKGTGQQAMLTVNSLNTANFRLFGPNNIARSGAAPNYISNNDLSIVNGTLQLTGSINIPNMIVDNGGTSSWPIPQNGALWINSSTVTVQAADNTVGDNKHFHVFGLLRVTNGTMNLGYSRGLLGGGSGYLLMEGGTINTWQLRTTNLGTGNNFAYVQSGGTINVGTAGLSGVDITDFPRFCLMYTTCTFQMSGGILNVGNPMNGGIGNLGGIMINTATSNTSVTGGTVNAFIPASGVNFTITSTASFYNLNINQDGAGAAVAILNSISAFDGVSTITETAQPLTVLNNLTLVTVSSTTLNCNANDLTVGGNFNIQASTTFTPGANTVTFNGSGAQTWTKTGTITSLNTVVVNKSAGTLTLAGGTLPNIATLTLTSGTMADGGNTVTVTTALTNNATHTSTGTGNITVNGPTTIGGTNGTFGNLTIQTNNTVATSGTQTVSGTLRLIGASSTLNIASNALTALGNIYSDAATGVAFTATKRILLSGFHNAGGLTRQGISGDLLFPVGSSAVGANAAVGYSPITINATATTQGTITVRPVNSEHPNVTTITQSLVYYWRVTTSGFSGITAVTHKTYTFSTATKAGTLTSYRSARYDRSANTWATNNTTYDATGTTVIPNFNTGTGWTGVASDQLDGEYTCGNIAAFGTVTTYYSRQSGNWNVNATWSTVAIGGAAASSNPTSCATCPVIIGDGASNNHTITTVAASSCGSLTLSSGSTLDCSTFTGHNFGTSTGGSVTGTGTLRIAAVGAGVANMFPAGDFTNFIGSSGGTVEWYGATKTIPATGPAPQNLSLATYYNLVLNPNAANTITLPASNLTIYNNLTQGNVAGFTGTSITNGARTIAISGSLTITLGTFSFSNAAASATTMTVTGNTTVGNGATFGVVAGGTANANTLSTAGGITNNGTINFNNTGTVDITFTGSSNVNFDGTGSGGTTLDFITVNKGTSQTPTVTFSVGGTVTAANNNVALGWLRLTNGSFIFNNSGTYTISSFNGSYTIPSTTKLSVNAGTVTILSSNTTAADLLLNGSLTASGTGTVNVGAVGNTLDNDLEYASAGTPTITVSGTAALNVIGSIRRSTSALSGALVYNQTGGTTTVGGNSSSNTRGVFEIDVNTGSSFTLTGTGALTVQRQTNGTSYADVYINPVTSSVSSTSTISVGLTTATTQANLRVNIAPSIGNFKVLGPGAAANPQTVNLYSNPLVLGGTLTIITPSVLVTNSFDVSIAGDLTVTGTGTATYTGGTNTTTFNGTGAQSANLTSTSTFTNITVNNSGGGTVTLSGTAPTLSNLNILSGILDVGSLALNVNGNITNNSSQTASGGGSITFTTTTSTSHTITSSSGSFTNLIIGGAAATNNLVTVSGNMTMNGTLDFTATAAVNRYLFIGSNLLTFSNTATISNAGSTKYIKTNGVSSDLGVTKNWPVGTNSFTYSVGTRTNYTPVTLTSLVVTTAGTYNVIPVDAAHPTSSATGEQILDYYWKITKDNTLVHGATGTLVFQVPTGLIGGSGGTLIGAYLDAINLIGWTSGGVISTVATNTLLTFTNALNTVMPAVNGEFDYTYGTTTTLPNPIAPVYSRFADADMVSNPTTVGTLGIGGSWAIATSWTLASNGFGAALSSVPTNRPVVILPAARINLDILGQSAFTTQLSGLLVVTTTGHNIGSISSTGTMRTTTSTLPAGTYTTFTASAGGTIEYAAAISMNNRSTYNNLLISSTVATTATNLTVNGNLTIGAGNTLDNSSNNANISIAGNWSNSGTYTAGTGTVTFNGTAAQSITGATTFNNLIINNTFGTSPQITLSGGNDIVSSTLTMTKGNINLNSQNLTIGTAAASPGTLSHSLASTEGWMYGGNLVRYFNTTTIADGSVTGFFPMGTSADFRPFFIGVPSGDMTTGGSFTVSNNSNNITTSVSIPDATSPVTPIVLQHQGYWSISSSGVSGGTYDLIAGGTGFGTVGNLADLNLCKATSVVGTYSAATNTTSDPRLKRIGLTLTDITTTDGDKFYVGSTNSVTSPLPIELLSFTGEAKKYGVDLQWKTASEKNNDYFTISRSAMGGTFESIGSVKGNGTTNSSHTYLLTDSKPLLGKNYYQLKQTDFDGHSTNSEVIVVNVINLEPLVSVYPNPISQHQPLNIVINGLEANSETEIQILNMQGIKINSRESITDSDGTLKTSVGLANLSTGLYILKVQNIYFKFVIE